jgi:hypothetical protein
MNPFHLKSYGQFTDSIEKGSYIQMLERDLLILNQVVLAAIWCFKRNPMRLLSA